MMKTSDAVIKRINEICQQQQRKICDCCLKGGQSPSAIYELMKGRTQCPKITTIRSFCEGVGMTLAEFFNCAYFNEVDDD